jgi:hypothetical protein
MRFHRRTPSGLPRRTLRAFDGSPSISARPTRSEVVSRTHKRTYFVATKQVGLTSCRSQRLHQDPACRARLRKVVVTFPGPNSTPSARSVERLDRHRGPDHYTGDPCHTTRHAGPHRTVREVEVAWLARGHPAGRTSRSRALVFMHRRRRFLASLSCRGFTPIRQR